MKRKGQPKRRKGKLGVARQRGGIAPLLAAAIPALAAGGKAAALGGLSALTTYGTRKAIQVLEKKKYKRRRRQPMNDQTESFFKRCVKRSQPK